MVALLGEAKPPVSSRMCKYTTVYSTVPVPVSVSRPAVTVEVVPMVYGQNVSA